MFPSFFLAGFECATGFNQHGHWIDQIAATHHDTHVDADYARLVACGIEGIREGMRWPLIDRGGSCDFSSALPFAHAANRHGLSVIWDLFHYGYPMDLDPFGEEFPLRFARYCAQAARWVAENTSGPWFFTPVNEPSYFAWAAGEQGLFAPHARHRGPELKRKLIRAAIHGINAIHDVLPNARMVNADPWCHMVAPRERADLQGACDHFNQGAVYESWDMLSGRLLPELGGSPRHLDIIGINYYWTNQWETGREGIPLADDDDRRWRLLDGITEVHARYGNRVMISETSHIGEKRSHWLREVAADCRQALANGIPLEGVCIYPILGMPEWHDPATWAQMGLWECQLQDGVLQRVLHEPMHAVLSEVRPLARRIAT